MKRLLASILAAATAFSSPAFAEIVTNGSGSGGGSGSNTIPSGNFAGRPASPSTGQLYMETDLGTGVLIIYTGSKWKPVGGCATILNDSATHTAAGTGAEANYANFEIIGGLISSTGSFYIFANPDFTGINGTKTIIIRQTTASGSTTGGTQLISNTFGGTANTLSGIMFKGVMSDSSTAAQTTTNSGIGGLGVVSSTALIAGGINLTNNSWINFNIEAASASDTVGYKGLRFDWCES